MPIASVEYTCDGDFDEAQVREATVVQVGDIYSRSSIRKSIEQIYSLREFSHIEVNAEIVENKVKLTFILSKRIEVGDITLSGHKELRRDDIIKVMQLEPGQRGQEYDESIARRDTEAIKRLYRERGFFNANISFDDRIDAQKRANITFKISEGGRPVVGKIIPIGVNKAAVSYEEILEAMKETKRGKAYAGQMALNSDARNIRRKYREKRYITAKVISAQALSDPASIEEYSGRGKTFPAENLTESDLKNGSVVIVIEIQQGKKVDIEILEIDANGKVKKNGDIDESVVLDKMRSINESVLRRSDEDIRNLYRLRGYYQAEVHHETLEDRIWNFDTDGDAEGWQPLPGATSFHSLGGVLQVSLSDEVPQIQSPEIKIDSDKYQKIQIRMKTDAGTTGRLYWTTDEGKTGYRDFKLVSDDRFHNYDIDMRILQITGRSLENLKSEGVSDDILDKLKDIEDHEFTEQSELMDVLKEKIGEQEFIRLRALILKHAERRRHKNWSDDITRIQFSLADAPGTNVDIAWVKVKMTEESILIVFTVTRNRIMKVRTKAHIVNTQGQEPELGIERVRKQMLTRKKHFLAFWPLKKIVSDGIFDEKVFEQDLRAIEALYKYEGYSQAKITDKKVEPDPDKGKINISIAIDEGPKTVITEVVLKSDGEKVLDYNEIPFNLPSFREQIVEIAEEAPSFVRYKIGSERVFREEDAVLDRSYLSSRYADKGYFAQTEVIKDFSDENTKVIITYNITAGKLIRLDDEIVIRGHARTKRRVLERELSDTLIESKIFNGTEVYKSWQNLLDLGFLRSVSIIPEPVGGSDGLHRLIVDVRERDAISVNAHLGSDSTAAFHAGLEASHVNLWGTGRRARGRVQVGYHDLGTEGTNFETTFELDYVRPWLLPWLLGARAQGWANAYKFSEVVDYEDTAGDLASYTERWTGGAAGIGKTFHRVNTFTGGYKYEVVDYLDILDLDDRIRKVAKIGSVETKLQRDTRNNLLNPTGGWLNAITLEYASEFLLGDETFIKVTMNNRLYHRLSQNLVLALDARTGYTRVLGGAERVLTPKQFNLDDYTTPRGYKWTADDAGNLMLNVSTELRFPLYKKLDGAVFFDSGYVYDEFSNFDVQDMNSSIGLGFRYISFIGPIRVDYGYPVQGTGRRNNFPHIAFGHAF
ncbi:POTRA domain-containing protein [Candidatus Poribacteria bacterium]